MEHDGSHVADVTAVADILEEVGVTAADLWSAESILWLEGASDVEVAKEIVDLDDYEIPVAFKAMPDAVRASTRNHRKAEEALTFCKAVSDAVLPVQVRMAFLFDSDEKKQDLRDQIGRATQGRAHFLPVRELENLFLSPTVIHSALAELCKQVAQPIPDLTTIEADLSEILAITDDDSLYPAGADGPDASRAVGSEVLRRLYWKHAITVYDKVRDGIQLARLTKQLEPGRLEPIAEIVRNLAGRTVPTFSWRGSYNPHSANPLPHPDFNCPLLWFAIM